MLPISKSRRIRSIPIASVRMMMDDFLPGTSSQVSGTATGHSILSVTVFCHSRHTSSGTSVSGRRCTTASPGDQQNPFAVRHNACLPASVSVICGAATSVHAILTAYKTGKLLSLLPERTRNAPSVSSTV